MFRIFFLLICGLASLGARENQCLNRFVENEDPRTLKVQVHEACESLTGWCSDNQAEILIDIVLRDRPETLLQVGVFGGNALIPLAAALKANGKGTLYAADPASLPRMPDESESGSSGFFGSAFNLKLFREYLIERIHEFELNDQIVFFDGEFSLSEIDMIYLDGGCSALSLEREVVRWIPLLRSRGWVIMTWFGNSSEGASKALEWLDRNCFPFARFKENIFWGIWIKP